MHHGTAVSYIYDGSLEGLLCCVFEAYYSKDDVTEIYDENGEIQESIFGNKYIVTDTEKSDRVWKSIGDKISEDARELVYLGHCCACTGRDRLILDFIRLGFRVGGSVTSMLTNDTVSALTKAVKNLTGEAHLYKGFVRFSIIGGALYSEIEPKNNVLPIIAEHFCDRYKSDSFVIYDKTRGQALIYQQNQSVIAPIENWKMPRADQNEMDYRRLWKNFYDTIAIKERYNPVCRRSHMPKRYWRMMTEMGFFDEKPTEGGKDEALETQERKFISAP